MHQKRVKSKYNIKFNLTEIITHKLVSNEPNKNEMSIDTNINNWKVTYYSNAQYIKGIIETTTLGNVKFENKHNKVFFSESGELQLVPRAGDEIITDVLMGYFEYTRSINSIESARFNEFLNFSEKSKNAIYKNLVALVERKLDQERFEKIKKLNK